jgi:uncharacterized OB-fold protein
MSPGSRQPIVDADSAPFWDAARANRLRLQQCENCARFVYYPRSLCPYCHTTALVWRDVSGLGRIYSYTVSRRPAGPDFESQVPYVVALVQLDEGPRMLTGILTEDIESLQCEQRVRVAFQDIGEGVVLPMFEVVPA